MMNLSRGRDRSASAAGALALVLCAAGPVHAAGFLIYDLSGEALGKASAVTASTREPAAVWFNPAALAFEGHGVALGAIGVNATSKFTPKDLGDGVVREKAETEPGRFVLPTFFAHARVHDNVAVGFGAYPAFGLSITWPGDWKDGRDYAIHAAITTLSLNPTVAIKLTDQVSFAVGASAVRGAVEFENGIPDPVGGTARIGGGTWGFAANAALLYRPLPDVLHLALTYRSRTKLDFKGRVDFDPGADFSRSLPDEAGTATIKLPDIISAGVMWRPVPNWTLTFDPNLVLWSTFDKLVIDFATAPDKVMQRNNHNAVTLRLGAEWATPTPGLALRTGFIFDQNPSPRDTLAPSLPDANRLDFALGVGYRHGWWKADLGYLLVYFLPSKSEGGTEGPQGTYRSVAQLLGLTVSAMFGR
jgi:long-chain fatty acid transport protein